MSLSAEIESAYEALVDAISKIPYEKRTFKGMEGTGGVVSVADLIAYQIGWGKLLISWYEAGVKGKAVVMPGEGFTSWDYVGLAKHFYKKYAFDSGKDQEREFAKVVDRILEIVEEEGPRVDDVGVWEWCTLKSGKKWPLRKWIMVNTVSPYKKARSMIRKAL